MLQYTVIATLPDEPTRSEYIAWLKAGHVQAVIDAGASTGLIIRIDEPATPPRVETRYTFPSRESLDRYLRDTAPRLRADGLASFGPDRSVTFERRIGSII